MYVTSLTSKMKFLVAECSLNLLAIINVKVSIYEPPLVSIIVNWQTDLLCNITNELLLDNNDTVQVETSSGAQCLSSTCLLLKIIP